MVRKEIEELLSYDREENAVRIELKEKALQWLGNGGVTVFDGPLPAGREETVEALMPLMASLPSLLPWTGYNSDIHLSGRGMNDFVSYLSDAEDYCHDFLILSEEAAEEGVDIGNMEKASAFLDAVTAITENPFGPGIRTEEELERAEMAYADLEKASNALEARMKHLLLTYGAGALSLESSALARAAKGNPDRKTEQILGKNGARKAADILKVRCALSVFRKMEEKVPRCSLLDGFSTPWEKVRQEMESIRSAISYLGSLNGSAYASSLAARMGGIRERYGYGMEKTVSIFSSAPMSTAGWKELFEKVRGILSYPSKAEEYLAASGVLGKAEEEGLMPFILFALEKGEKDLSSLYRASLLEKDVTESGELRAAYTSMEKAKAEEKRRGIVEFPPYIPFDTEGEAARRGVINMASPLWESLVLSLLEAEAPVLERDAAKKLSFLSFSDPSLLRTTLDATLSALSEKGIRRKDGFVYIDGKEIVFRESSFRRDFSHIAPEELLDGMERLVAALGPMTNEELFRRLGDKCGMKSVLTVRYVELERVLRKSGKLVSEDGIVKEK